MNTYKYDLKHLDANDRTFFCEMLSYVSENIISTQVSGDFVLISYENMDETSIRSNIEYLENMIKENLKNFSADEMKTKVISDHTDVVTLNHEPVFEKLKTNNFAKCVSSGSFAYSGLFLKIFKYFCRKIDSFGEELFSDSGFEQYEVPELIPVDEYEKGKYFETFPHHIMFETEMKNNISTIDRFAKNGIKDSTILNDMKKPRNVLRTAACMPIYVFLRDSDVDPKAPKCFMVSGKCFRNEGGNIKELSRLNEFYMKEFVLIGLPEQTKSFIKKAQKLWDFFFETFHLNCKVETACDSFFASNYKKLRLFQIMGDSKQEFRLNIPANNEYISCSSANFHRTHFTKIYNIKNKDSGTLCHSACLAFGIDRLTYSLLSQKGLDISKWDQDTVDEIRKFVKI